MRIWLFKLIKVQLVRCWTFFPRFPIIPISLSLLLRKEALGLFSLPMCDSHSSLLALWCIMSSVVWRSDLALLVMTLCWLVWSIIWTRALPVSRPLSSWVEACQIRLYHTGKSSQSFLFPEKCKCVQLKQYTLENGFKVKVKWKKP